MSKKQIQQLQKEVQELKEMFLIISKTSLANEVWLDSADLKIQFNFSESKLYRMRKTNQIPNEKIGGRYYYPKSYFTQILMNKIKSRE